jgi:hypothetical protein
MAHIRAILDPIGKTLTVYWDDPEHEGEEMLRGLIQQVLHGAPRRPDMVKRAFALEALSSHCNRNGWLLD